MSKTDTTPDPREPSRAETLKSRALPYFAVVAAVWFLISAVLCFKVSPDGADARRALTWLGILGGICVLDLFALAQALAGLFDLMQGDSTNPIFLVIRTSYWGGIKLVCVIFLGFLMARAAHQIPPIPTIGLLTGVSTLLVVPLFGFLFWFKGFTS
jgi:hypothetical protein